ncbi:YqzG/YhdC family protein [Bacillus sp. NPDC093026]|uniref:YqzG/YhdC family protein n=1 Tax=Bacillus sp. NPDC093026 TaxID=3363948 RepID=UPI0038103878
MKGSCSAKPNQNIHESEFNKNMQPKLWMLFLVGVILLGSFITHPTLKAIGQPVEKWERIAYTALQDEYEGASLNDYHYIGRTQVNDEQTKDVFRVTVKNGSALFAAHAEIYFHPVTGHLISINVFRL